MVLISFIGSFLYTTIEARKHFRPDVFDIKIFFRENKFKWLYSFTVCSLLAIIINLIPDTSEAIKAVTGLAVSEKIASFLTLGYALCASMKRDKSRSSDQPNPDHEEK